MNKYKGRYPFLDTFPYIYSFQKVENSIPLVYNILHIAVDMQVMGNRQWVIGAFKWAREPFARTQQGGYKILTLSNKRIIGVAYG